MNPQRIKRYRGKPFSLPHTKAVDRTSRWGNPYKVTKTLPADLAVRMYRVDLLEGDLPFTVEDVRRELAGWNLACYCDLGEPCHGDFLLEVADALGRIGVRDGNPQEKKGQTIQRR